MNVKNVKDEVKLSLKLMVDRKKNRVAFAEARKDFVDFIFHILSLPLNTVVQHLKDKGMAGCLGSVYDSFFSLGSDYFQPKIEKYQVYLFNPSFDVIVPRLSLNSDEGELHLFKCPSHDRFTSKVLVTCPIDGCHKQMYGSVGRYVSLSSSNAEPGFMKAAVSYMVMDNLEVKPLTISVLKEQDRLNNLGYLEEKVVQVGVNEAVEILKASLETKAVLTTVFLEDEQIDRCDRWADMIAS